MKKLIFIESLQKWRPLHLWSCHVKQSGSHAFFSSLPFFDSFPIPNSLLCCPAVLFCSSFPFMPSCIPSCLMLYMHIAHRAFLHLLLPSTFIAASHAFSAFPAHFLVFCFLTQIRQIRLRQIWVTFCVSVFQDFTRQLKSAQNLEVQRMMCVCLNELHKKVAAIQKNVICYAMIEGLGNSNRANN